MIDITKPLKTRDGQTVTILSDKARGDYPIIGYIGDSTSLSYWSVDGQSIHESFTSPLDLVPACEFWLNIYSDNLFGMTNLYESKEQADRAATKDRIACVRVEFEEGQFDD